MTGRPLSNSLTVLAHGVRTAMNVSVSAEKTAIQAALEAGRLLSQAKAECPHGEWLNFLAGAGVPERKAQRYMKLAWSGLKSDTVSDLGGIKATLRWMDGLRLPDPGECLIVSLDNCAQGIRKPLAIAWPEEIGMKFAVFNPLPGESFVDLLTKPIVRTEYVLPAIYAALNNRFREMSFHIVPHDMTTVEMFEELASGSTP
jgi:hypothetical protein